MSLPPACTFPFTCAPCSLCGCQNIKHMSKANFKMFKLLKQAGGETPVMLSVWELFNRTCQKHYFKFVFQMSCRFGYRPNSLAFFSTVRFLCRFFVSLQREDHIQHFLSPYLCSLQTPKPIMSCNLWSCGQIMNIIPRTRTVFSEHAFKVFAPSSWCNYRDILNWITWSVWKIV